MRTLRFAGLLAVCAAGCVAGPAPEQAPPRTQDPAATASALQTPPTSAEGRAVEVDKVFGWTKPDLPGCAVGVSQQGKQVLSRAYGSADLERDAPITPDSVFDIGSLQKQFVAASILLLAEDGKLSLSDDVHKYIPELPGYGQTITLNHLLTHTSGIRDWTALLPLAADKPTALTAILRQRGLNFAPGEEWSYSNSNYVLLKEIVARTSGKSFTEFARTRLFEPLGMKASSYSVDMLNIIRHRALAYEKADGGWKLSMRLETDRGGGGLLSTTGDMLIWNEALASGRLGSFVTEKLHETAKLNNGRSLRYARGLIVDSDQGLKMVWHSGGSAGYNAWLGRYPDYGLALALACNQDVDGGTLVREVFNLFLPANARGPGLAASATAPDPNANARAGVFVSESNGELMRLGVDRGRLRIAGGPPLVMLGADRFGLLEGELFFRSQDALEMRFLSADEFEMKSMEGKTTRFRRAEPWSPAAADLRALAGRYESKELKTVFDIAPGQNLLLARLEHAPERPLQFRPIFRDTFQIGNATLRFQRDKAGKVIDVDYSNPVLRNIRLTRLS